MRILFPLAFALAFVIGLGLIEIALLRFLNKRWWQKKLIRRSAIYLPIVGIVMIIGWGAGEYYTLDWLLYPSAFTAVVVFVLEVALMLSLPFSGILQLIQHLIDWITKKRRPEKADAIDSDRRNLLKTTAAAIPAVTLLMGVGGVTASLAPVSVYRKKFKFANLPSELEGFSILHLSDLHLRHYVQLDDLEQVLSDASTEKPDLVLVTGDIADDISQLPEALKMIDQLGAPYGAYASLGNHEYFRGIESIHRIFERSAIPLFVNQSTRINVGETSLFIGGIDDPRRLGGSGADFYRNCLERTLPERRNNEFAVMMSHRPDAFDDAAAMKIDLTLAGHTHGGQLGIAGHSLMESFLPEKYLWGHYQKEDSHLYTSSGVGHWFPFRLGCPAEAPVIELTRG